MLGYYVIGALALVLVQPSSAALNATTANSVCNLLMDGTLISGGDDNNCALYYSCTNGTATSATCPSGYSFSVSNQACLSSSSSAITCGSADANPCATASDGTFVSVPNSCTDFYYCKNSVGSRGSCQSGLNFDASTQSCNYTIDYPCTTTNGDASDSINLCAVIPGGKYFASSTSCQAWQECRSGALVSGACPSPYYFNVNTGACDYQDNVSCRQVNGDTSTGTDPGYLAGTACKYNGLIVSDNSTCAGYYLCNNYIYSYGTCSGGLYYNPPTKTCVNRVNAVNNCNRCENTKLMFVNLYQDNCEGYAYCSDGRMASTGTCADGYFDEVAQACVLEDDIPQYAVCNDSLGGVSTSSTESTGSTESTESTESTSTVSTTADPTTTTKDPTA